MKKQPSQYFGEPTENAEKRINILIEQYQKQIQSAIAAAPYSPVVPATGMLFSISA
jgi:hypothetical protein